MSHAPTLRVLVLAVLVLAAGLGATSQLPALGPNGRAADARAIAHVTAAVQAAEAWYQDPFGGHGSYRGLSSAALMHEAPAVSADVFVRVLAAGHAYCVADVEGPGHSAYEVGGRTGRISSLAGAAASHVTLADGSTDAVTICARMS